MPRFSLTRFRYQLHAQLRVYRERRRSRRQLLTLDDRLLNDIGITRAQARKEGRKAFWKRTHLERDLYENR